MDRANDAELSDLVGRIYECALSPERWDETLATFVERFDTPGWNVAMLLESRQSPPAGRFLGVAGLDHEAREFYLAHFAGRNPWTSRIGPSPLGMVVDSDDLMTRTELLESAFYKDFLYRWKMQRAVAIIVERRAGKALGFIMAGPGDADLDRLKGNLCHLAPHLERAVAISQVLGVLRLRLQAAETALDNAPDAMVMLTPSLDVVSSNHKAHALAAQNAFSMAGGFKFFDAKAQIRLLALARAAAPASATFLTALPDGRMLPVQAARIPTQAAAVIGGTMLGAALMISVGGNARDRPIGPEALVTWFGLTPAEANLTAALAGGTTLKEHATGRGVSINAARFLLKGIYRKIGVASQAQLIAQVRGLPLH